MLKKSTASFRSAISEHQIKEEFNLNVMCEKLKELRKLYEKEVKREINNVERRKKGMAILTEQEIRDTLMDDPKMRNLLFHPFFDEEFPVREYRRSLNYQSFLKQIYLEMSQVLNEEESG